MSPERITGRATLLGEGLAIVRALPSAGRRTIGAWCFLDHFGPADVAAGRGLRVGPHPHTGLQTVTWLLEGEILHRDSLGCVQPIRPGQLNLMTSGHGISHSEESPVPRPPRIHGAQLWLALPESRRHGPPAFAHHAALPRRALDGCEATVFVGRGLGLESPAQVHTPLVGLELKAPRALAATLPLEPGFEHGVIVLEGAARLDGEPLAPGELLYFAPGRSALALETDAAAVLLVVGGEPFAEDVLMWWNFVGRSREELTAATREWNAGAARFGSVTGYDGERLSAPLPPWSAA